MRAVPGNLVEVNAVEEERYLAAALFGLAGSPAGRDVLLKHPATIKGALGLQSLAHRFCPAPVAAHQGLQCRDSLRKGLQPRPACVPLDEVHHADVPSRRFHSISIHWLYEILQMCWMRCHVNTHMTTLCMYRRCLVLPAMAAWAASKDPILTRQAIGTLARLVTTDMNNVAIVAEADGLRALVAALGSSDAQAQCYAAKAVGTPKPCTHTLSFEAFCSAPEPAASSAAPDPSCRCTGS